MHANRADVHPMTLIVENTVWTREFGQPNCVISPHSCGEFPNSIAAHTAQVPVYRTAIAETFLQSAGTDLVGKVNDS
jgi:hypothetical protein